MLASLPYFIAEVFKVLHFLLFVATGCYSPVMPIISINQHARDD